MEQSKGFEEGRADFIWKLHKMLYGTMQGTHNWAENLNKTFKEYDYYKSSTNPQFYSKVIDDELTITLTWTDNILGALSILERELLAKAQLSSSYEIKDLGEAKLILEMHVIRNVLGDITLFQQAYCKQIIKCFNIGGYVPTSTPLSPGITLLCNNCLDNAHDANKIKNIPYHEALGLFIWLQVATRPNLSFVVNMLSRFTHNPRKLHWNALKHILAYTKGTTHYRVIYKIGGNLLWEPQAGKSLPCI